jgi:hypothetical protein
LLGDNSSRLHEEMCWLAAIRNLGGSLLEVDVTTVRRSAGTGKRTDGEVVGVAIHSKEPGEGSNSGGVLLFEKM